MLRRTKRTEKPAIGSEFSKKRRERIAGLAGGAYNQSHCRVRPTRRPISIDGREARPADLLLSLTGGFEALKRNRHSSAPIQLPVRIAFV